jgi:hypothetical protein
VEGNSTIWFKNLSKREGSLLNKNVVIFAFFLFLAFIFWYLNSMGKEIKSEFKYNVNFINSPKGRVISGDFQSKLTLELKGQGYSLLKRKVSGYRTPLVVDLSKAIFKRIPDPKSIRYYILSAGLIPNFKKQIGNGFEIISVKPDTIFLMFNVVEKVSDKQVK